MLSPTVPPQEPGNCPLTVEKSWIPFRGHCYHFEASSKMSWPKASLACLQLGKCFHSLIIISDFILKQVEETNIKILRFVNILIERMWIP